MKIKRRVRGWDLWRDGVTFSFISSFLECREQTRLAYCELLNRKDDAYPLMYGSLIHWVLAKLSKKQNPDPAEIALEIAMYDHQYVRDTLTSEVKREQWKTLCALAQALLEGYVEHWAEDWSDKDWTALEQPFATPYKYSDGKETRIRGVRDGVFRSRRGRLWLFETKVKSRINHEQIKETLPWNLQVLLYLWSYPPPGILDGVVYNLVRWPSIRTGDLEKRLRKDIKDRPTYYFHRLHQEIGTSEVKQFEEQILRPVMEEIRMWYEGKLPHYMNPHALVNVYGKSRFYDYLLYGSTHLYKRRDKVFNEIEEIE